ncbi:MAG: hypothetical protein QXV01_11640 [Candidatus Bathyarchaeia archaeon]
MDAKGRSLFLVLASSGMRIGEALKLKVEDFDLNPEPAKKTLGVNTLKAEIREWPS